jgi:predicted DNA-binding protein with PD1-like motif
MMKIAIAALALFPTAAVLPAQRTRTEVTKPTTAADDARPNSAKVPDVVALPGHFQRVVLLRFKHRADLLAGFERMVKEQKIRNGVILSGIGSLIGYHYHVVSNRTFPSKNVFVKDPTMPVDIANMNGYILGGRVHAHITIAAEDKAMGGHLEPGNKVFTFAAITIWVLGDDMDLSRLDDKTLR